MKEITLPAIAESIPKVTEWIDAALEELGCSMKAQMQLDVAIDELFGNIAAYAYGQGQGDATVRLDFNETDRTVSITFLDSGMPFDPLAKDDPNVNVPAAERAIGGLGIYLVKKTMDSMEYRFENGMNILTIHKRI